MILSPAHFDGYDIVFDIAFCIITLYISYRSYRMHQFFSKREHRDFSIAFGFMSIGYLCNAIGNIIGDATHTATITTTTPYLFMIGADEIFILIGLLLLIFTYFDVKDWLLRAFIVALVIASFIASGLQWMVFFLTSALALLFITWKLFLFYRREHKTTTLLVCIGFGALFVGKVFLSAGIDINWLYVTAYIVRLIGFCLILIGSTVLSR